MPSSSSNVFGTSTTRSTWQQLCAKSDGGLSSSSSSEDGSSRKQVSSNQEKKKKKNAASGGAEHDLTTGRFAIGNELKRLRADLESLRENLSWAEAMEDQDRIDDLTKAIKNGENRDPDIVYRRALRAVIDAKASFKLSEDEKKRRVKKWKKEANAARTQLPRFQMEGLWVGR